MLGIRQSFCPANVTLALLVVALFHVDLVAVPVQELPLQVCPTEQRIQLRPVLGSSTVPSALTCNPPVTVTITLVAAPAPPALVPVRLNWVVVDGVTVHVDLVEPAHEPPNQANEVAAGLQVAMSVEVPPTVTDAGLALSVHVGTANAATAKVLLTAGPVPPALTPATV